MIKVITYNGIKKDTKNMTLGHGKKIKLVKLYVLGGDKGTYE